MSRLGLKIALVLALLAPVAALAQNPYRLKPGAQGKVCISCHTEFEEQMKLASVHTPVKSGECSDCHNPHAASHGQLLATDKAQICADCHADVVPEEAGSVHAAIVESGCVICHDPHASDNPNVLLQRGNQLCFECHDDVAATVNEAEFSHSPVVESCLTCHDPHASTSSDFLLTKETGSLCSDCHNPRRASFVERHQGYDVAGSRCSSCHDPHGSDTSGILLAEVHEPVTTKKCNQCHGEPAAGLDLKRTGINMCRGCHAKTVNEAFASNEIHWPIAGGEACLSCHSPHASSQKGLLHGHPTEMCGECHRETVKWQEASLAVHAPVADGDCTACHASHAADNPLLMESADVIELCGACHDWETHSSHPIGPEIVDQRNPNLIVDCLSCHRSHGSTFKALSHDDPDGALCVQCHQEMAR